MRLILAAIATTFLTAAVVAPGLQTATQSNVTANATEWSAAKKKTKVTRKHAHKKQAEPERYLRAVPAR